MNTTLPNIQCAIIGAYKAGTTSLKNYLGEHPNIATHVQLEFDYFINPISGEQLHEVIRKEFNIEEQTTSYVIKHVKLYRNQDALERLSNMYPNILYIFIVRDPVQRAYSAWKMQAERGDLNEPFENLIPKLEKNEKDSFFYNSVYSPGLYGKCYENILKYVKKDRIMLIDFEELKNNPNHVCSKIFSAINVNDYSPNTDKIHNSSKPPKYKWLKSIILFIIRNENLKKLIKKVVPYKLFISISHKLREFNQKDSNFSPLDDTVSKKIHSFYAKDIELLESLSGKRFPNWKSANSNCKDCF